MLVYKKTISFFIIIILVVEGIFTGYYFSRIPYVRLIELLVLLEDGLNRKNIFNIEKIIALRNNYLKGKYENISKLWYIFIFEMWFER